MKATAVFATLTLLAAVLTVLPSAQAIQAPPQCQTIGGSCCGIEPAFAPCCTLLSCPPTLRCPELDFDTTDLVLFLGPSAGAETDADCSANACLNSSSCSDASCASGAQTCCSLAGAQSYCTSLATSAAETGLPSPCGPTAYCTEPSCPPISVGTSDFLAYLGPHVRVVVSSDCNVDVHERGLVCPSLAPEESEVRYGASRAEVVADTCNPVIDCTCDPILEAA